MIKKHTHSHALLIQNLFSVPLLGVNLVEPGELIELARLNLFTLVSMEGASTTFWPRIRSEESGEDIARHLYEEACSTVDGLMRRSSK